MTLTVSHRIVSHTLGNDEGFTLLQLYGPLIKLDTQVSLEHKKKSIFVFVTMPSQLAMHFSYLHIDVIDRRNDARRPFLLQSGRSTRYRYAFVHLRNSDNYRSLMTRFSTTDCTTAAPSGSSSPPPSFHPCGA
jgi:hypothetical protein